MVLKYDYPFPASGQTRRLHIYLPEDYECSGERYPVLYMFDGHNLFYDSDATYGTCLGLREYLDSWWKKLIVVGLECAGDDRTRVDEYCPFGLRSYQYGWVSGTGDTTMRWICEDVKAHIDSTYRTWSSREATAIAGYSWAGMMALYGVLRYNEVFSKAAAISPSIVPSIDCLLKEAEQDPMNPDTRIFFSWGTEEYDPGYNHLIEEDILRLEAAVQQKGAKTWLMHHIGGQHNEASWRQQVPEWMRFHWEG